jgi:hypothetical protein
VHQVVHALFGRSEILRCLVDVEIRGQRSRDAAAAFEFVGDRGG